jgi:hypothetical protein
MSMGARFTVGSGINKMVDELGSGESIQFADLVGSPRITVTADGRLEIMYDVNGGEIAIRPIVSNVIQIRVVK